MSLAPEFTPASRSPAYRWLRRWQFGLNLFLLGAALVLGMFVLRRALFLLFVVPVAFVPFSYARLRLHTHLEGLLRSHPRTAPFCGLFTGLGVLLDCVLIAQFLTARSGHAIPIVHSAGISWAGAIWFSAHGLLFLGYVLLDLGRLSGRLVRWVLHGKLDRPAIPPAAPFSP